MALTIDLASVDNVNLLSLDTDTPGKSLWFILFRLPASAKAGAMLKEGDKAQAVTLTLLEKTRPFMEKDLQVHDRLHERYDEYGT
ncbi:hypothetical protein EVJ58_g5355 [Rhodofomes roseus]|uniref:Uncharacterized protein n=1 Tax=Rhodofomes roseus TaxID=34475 RepID=A0A4Y9YCP1_9APHY|nr:hypothetical protein EVJ58_g5355 [Rhodofomes roseus]